MTKSSNRFAEALEICRQKMKKYPVTKTEEAVIEALTIAAELQAQKDNTAASGAANGADRPFTEGKPKGSTGRRLETIPQPDQPSDEIRERVVDLLTVDEEKLLLIKAEYLFEDIIENRPGGLSGVNRPFSIKAYFKEVIEDFGKRNIGYRMNKYEIEAALAQKPETEAVDLDVIKAMGFEFSRKHYGDEGSYLTVRVAIQGFIGNLVSSGLLRVKESK